MEHHDELLQALNEARRLTERLARINPRARTLIDEIEGEFLPFDMISQSEESLIVSQECD